jgi:hypothetical protein
VHHCRQPPAVGVGVVVGMGPMVTGLVEADMRTIAACSGTADRKAASIGTLVQKSDSICVGAQFIAKPNSSRASKRNSGFEISAPRKRRPIEHVRRVRSVHRRSFAIAVHVTRREERKEGT